MRKTTCLVAAALLALPGCGEMATLPDTAGTGPDPVLPPPHKTLVPTFNIAKVVGWPVGGKPIAAPGFEVREFARDLDHPRWLLLLPNGDVLVAETNAPPRKEPGGLRAMVMKLFMRKAGAGTPSANRITLLRDKDGDGVAETRSVFASNLNSPFGMALVGNAFYVADTDAVLRFGYTSGALQLTGAGEKVADLPAGQINHHWTKGLIASRDGSSLYATVGSNSNVGENGLANEVNRAAILRIELASGKVAPFATGLRNPNGLAWQPQDGRLWTTVNERDEIGSDLVPDYMTAVREGGFYGWPYSYYGQNVDRRVKPQDPGKVAAAIKPDYALGAHTASLGLAFYDSSLFPQRYRGGAFVGQHGSWNRQPRSGYRVIFVPFAAGRPAGSIEEVLTGFLNTRGEAQGRPVGVAVDAAGALLVADDVGNVIWRVTPTRR